MFRPNSRHNECKIPSSLIPRPLTPALKKSVPVRIIAPKTTISLADGIVQHKKTVSFAHDFIHQVQKVSADVDELQKNMAVESAARNDLQLCVEKLKADNAETRKYFAQAVADSRPKDGGGVKQSLRLLMKTLPCKSLVDLDWLLAYILIRNSHWVEYIKLLGGSDFNLAIKTALNATMTRSVQKELSWTGNNTRKPSLKHKYKEIVDGIHMAMNERFTDYTIDKGEAKLQSLLKNAARN